MNLLERAISLLTPDDCLRCGREGSLLCSRCMPALALPPERCFGCDVKITAPAIGCPDCLQKAGLAQLAAVTQHAGAAAELVRRLKFDGNRSAAGVMARCMLAAGPALSSDVLLVNVPATNEHIRQRGFDQAALLMCALARRSRLPCRSLLLRSGHRHQFGSNKATRLSQLRGAIRVTNPAAVRGRRIVLVDDVLTTGASLTASAHALRQAGAWQVDALVFARAGRVDAIRLDQTRLGHI